MSNADIHVIEAGNPDEAYDLAKAKEVGKVLDEYYPDHPWIVSFTGRVLAVRHMEISLKVRIELGRDGFGFVLKHYDCHSASDLARNAVMAGGQMLETFGLKRGRWDGTEPVVPRNWKRGEERFH